MDAAGNSSSPASDISSNDSQEASSIKGSSRSRTLRFSADVASADFERAAGTQWGHRGDTPGIWTGKQPLHKPVSLQRAALGCAPSMIRMNRHANSLLTRAVPVLTAQTGQRRAFPFDFRDDDFECFYLFVQGNFLSMESVVREPFT